MPMRAPPPMEHPNASEPTLELVTTAVSGLLSPDAVQLKKAVFQFLDPKATLRQHLCVAEGRWNVFRVLQANAALFDTRHKIQTVYTDPSKLKALAKMDLAFKPRVPLRQFLPEVTCPTTLELTFAKGEQGLHITALAVDHSTFYLTGVPGLHWLHHQLVMPAGAFVAQSISDALQFGLATRVFVERQLMTRASAGGK